MAIVKATYTKQAAAAKATIRYIQNRRGKDGVKIQRTLWGSDGKMTRQEAYRMVDEAEQGSVFYRLVINFDPAAEDTDKDIYITEITEQTMLSLEAAVGKTVHWVAATHADHTLLRHIHLVAALPRRLQVHDLQALRAVATEAALAQRQARDASRELQSQHGQEEGAEWEQAC
jgi:hypothetical protein